MIAEKMAGLMKIFQKLDRIEQHYCSSNPPHQQTGKTGAAAQSDWAEARGSGEIISSSDVVLKSSQINQHSGKLE